METRITGGTGVWQLELDPHGSAFVVLQPSALAGQRHKDTWWADVDLPWRRPQQALL